MPEAHIEKAERKHNQAGVFIAVDQVLRLRNFGQPWRMKQTPMNKRRSNRVASVKVEGPEGITRSPLQKGPPACDRRYQKRSHRPKQCQQTVKRSQITDHDQAVAIGITHRERHRRTQQCRIQSHQRRAMVTGLISQQLLMDGAQVGAFQQQLAITQITPQGLLTVAPSARGTGS